MEKSLPAADGYLNEAIIQKYQRIVGLIHPGDCLPLLRAIAEGEWTPQDARNLSYYFEGITAERKRVLALIEDSVAETEGEACLLAHLEEEIAGIEADGKDRGCDPPQAK